MQPQQQPNPDKERQGGVALVIFLIFSATRSVQIFSRVPGTTGPWFLCFMFWIGLGMQLYYYQANVHASGQLDAIPDRILVYGQIAWLAVHWICRQINYWKGMRFHSYEPGLGVLYRVLPTSLANWVGTVSDIVMAAVLGGICYLFSCPILGSWYLAMIPWLLIARALIYGRENYQLQRLHDTQVEADVWTQRLRDRQLWMEVQRERWGDRYQ